MVERPGYYDRQGRPLKDMLSWARLFENDSYQRVALTEIDGLQLYTGWFKWTLRRPRRVSTVWLGLDHNWALSGPPIIFETMVFGGEDWGGEYQLRYSTEDQALRGHALTVKHFTYWWWVDPLAQRWWNSWRVCRNAWRQLKQLARSTRGGA